LASEKLPFRSAKNRQNPTLAGRLLFFLYPTLAEERISESSSCAELFVFVIPELSGLEVLYFCFEEVHVEFVVFCVHFS
jgi:hypothetical protein